MLIERHRHSEFAYFISLGFACAVVVVMLAAKHAYMYDFVPHK